MFEQWKRRDNLKETILDGRVTLKRVVIFVKFGSE